MLKKDSEMKNVGYGGYYQRQTFPSIFLEEFSRRQKGRNAGERWNKI
jgi:hypothetical protein